MTETKRDVSGDDREVIVDRIYEIALEPSSLEDFIDFWHDTEIERDLSDFNTIYKPHLDRAQSFLHWGEAARPDLSAYLRPYENLAAFIVSKALVIEASNSGGESAFGIRAGETLNQIPLPDEIRNELIDAVQDVLSKPMHVEKTLRADFATKGGALLFRVAHIADSVEHGPIVLVVSTHFHWRDRIGVLLGSQFHLTKAEQDVARQLVEGHETNAIAVSRKTSEGTVRGQIKSIIGKMNLRSQKDIIRLVMSLGDFPKNIATHESGATPVPSLSKNWLESEVWKPFKAMALPDGRTLNYHDMGPLTGDPILFSHMGSCMVRWPRSMIRMAFDNNLRIVCPIRAGYGPSTSAVQTTNAFDVVRNDCIFLLHSLGITRVPYAVQGSDFPFAADMIAHKPGFISELIGIGARPCLPGGENIDGLGRWQKFFVSAAQKSPHLVNFASKALMAMCKRIGPEAMLRQLCKDSPADLALLEMDDLKQVLVANIELMAGKSTNSARAFAWEYSAFQGDWSERVSATADIPVRLFLAEEDPTVDLSALPKLNAAYPWMQLEVLPDAGLALVFQHPETLIPIMAEAAKRAASGAAISLQQN